MPAITSASWKSGWSRLDGVDCEAQLKKGIEPWARMLSISACGELVEGAGGARAVGEGRGEVDERGRLAGHALELGRSRPCPRGPRRRSAGRRSRRPSRAGRWRRRRRLRGARLAAARRQLIAGGAAARRRWRLRLARVGAGEAAGWGWRACVRSRGRRGGRWHGRRSPALGAARGARSSDEGAEQRAATEEAGGGAGIGGGHAGPSTAPGPDSRPARSSGRLF